MNRDEILEKSRQENKFKDEMERDIFQKAGQRACAAGALVCALIIILEAFFADTAQINFAVLAVCLSMTGTMLVTKYTRLRKIHELIFGSLELILAAVFLVLYIIRLVG